MIKIPLEFSERLTSDQKISGGAQPRQSARYSEKRPAAGGHRAQPAAGRASSEGLPWHRCLSGLEAMAFRHQLSVLVPAQAMQTVRSQRCPARAVLSAPSR